MANRIKGITIEFNGDTTKLTDSLKKVDSSLKNTQTQLRDVNKLLKLDPKNIELLKQKQELLTKAVKDTKDRIDQLKTAMKQMEEAGITDANREQYQALQREIIETESSLESLRKEAAKASPALQLIGTTAGEVAEKTKKLSTAAAGALAAFGGMAFSSALAADDLATLSKQTGLTVEELQKMNYASDLIDVSTEDMAKSVAKLTQQMGSGSKVFEELGVSITDADGNMRDATEVWYETLDALGNVENGTKRDQLAMQLFGEEAAKLAGIVDDGGEALKALGDEAEATGLILSEDAVNDAVAFNDQMDKLKNTASQAFFKAGSTLATTLVPMLEKLVTTVSEVLEWFGNLDGDTQMLILTVLGLVAAISPVAGLISGITTVVGALSTAMTFLTGPIGLAIAAIAAIIAIAVSMGVTFDDVKAVIKRFADFFVQKWNDLLRFFGNVKSGFISFRDTVIGVFDNIGQKISGIMDGAKKAVQNAVDKIKGIFSGFKWEWPKLKMPHFTFSGSINPFDWATKGTPKIGVQWYAKAMHQPYVLDGPTIFGMSNGKLLGGGEAGQEVIMSKQMADQMAAGSTINVTINAAPGMNEKAVADYTINQIQSQIRKGRFAW